MRRTRIRILLLLGFAGLLPLCLHALTFVDVDKTCPLCQHKFTCRLARSGYTSDRRLDLKPLGRTAAPWPVPVCPRCDFVIYDDEIGAEELEKCRKLVASEEYARLKARASYRKLAALYQHLGKEDTVVADCFLKASWQEESNAVYYLEDLDRGLALFQAHLEAAEEKDESWATTQVLVGEILRLLGRFDEAAKHFESLATLGEFQDNFLEQVIRYELKLCEKKDLHHHTMSEVEEAASSE